MILPILILPILITIGSSAPSSSDYQDFYPPYDSTSHRARIQDPDELAYEGNPYETSQCKRNATCIRSFNATCYGSPVQYDFTSLDLVLPGYTPSMIKQQLRALEGLRYIPQCWSVVRPLLCSLFMPKCINGTIERLSQRLCHNVLKSCRLIINEPIWPKFIDCDNEDLFLPRCRHDPHKSNDKTMRCPASLVPTLNTQAAFDGIDGCGKPCKDPFYNDEEREQIRHFIAWGAGISCFLNFIAVVTFLIDWQSSNKFPASVIFYINCCYMICCLGWLVQFLADNSDIVVCRVDGTLRKNEPNGDLACVLIFILVYYPLISAMIWFVILTYTWHTSIQPYSKMNNRLEKKSAYFHLLAWCLPLMLTVAVMGMSEVDGDSMTGICFVGRYNSVMRMGFVLGPVGAAMVIGGYFLIRGVITLIGLMMSTEGVVSEKVREKLRDTIVRMGLFSVAIIITVGITIHCHMYDFKNYEGWEKSFRNYIVCWITTRYTDPNICKINSRPSVTKLQLHLFALFFSGVVMSSWVWTGASFKIWMRLFSRDSSDKPVKLKKHEVIAQAYSKRKMLEENGRVSITCHNEDPVGLNFDPDSVTSQDFSANWVAALPHLVERRGALVGSVTTASRRDSFESRCSTRRSSNDSKYSFSMRKVAIASRRNSGDSQFAVSISEVTARGQLPYRVVRDSCGEDDNGSKRKNRRVKEKRRKIRGYKVGKSRRTARGYVNNHSQDTPAVDTDYSVDAGYR